jgi:sec-independent protein translocase protein TatA
MIWPTLFLNDVAGSEILVIFLVILLFFGSKSIPSIAKSLGRALFEFRNATNEIKQEIKNSGGDIKGDLNLDSFLKETTEEIQRPLDQVFTDVDNAVHYDPVSSTQRVVVTAGNAQQAEQNNKNEEKKSND